MVLATAKIEDFDRFWFTQGPPKSAEFLREHEA